MAITKNINLTPELENALTQMMAQDGTSNRSEFFRGLIREEYRRRQVAQIPLVGALHGKTRLDSVRDQQ